MRLSLNVGPYDILFLMIIIIEMTIKKHLCISPFSLFKRLLKYGQEGFNKGKQGWGGVLVQDHSTPQSPAWPALIRHGPESMFRSC